MVHLEGLSPVHKDAAIICKPEDLLPDPPPASANDDVKAPVADGDGNEHDVGPSVSQTSTVQYDQETFATFKDKVQQLCLEVFPLAKPEHLKIERMRGGSHNRIIGITISDPQSGNEEKYILRVPRMSFDDSIELQAATLKFVAERCKFPVPLIHSHDPTKNNPLESTYMIQHRLPGICLYDVWLTLNLIQKKSMVEQMAKIIVEMFNITNPNAGVVSPTNTSSSCPQLVQFEDEYPDNRQNLPSKPQTTVEFLLERCQEWRAKDHDVQG